MVTRMHLLRISAQSFSRGSQIIRMHTTLLGHRLVFAALVTYMATQAHGWAGGLATRPSVTILTWVGVSAATILMRTNHALLVVALGTQLGIHFGTAGVHTHCTMQLSMIQMAIGHIIAGTLAWILLYFSERSYLLGIEALKFALSRMCFQFQYLHVEYREAIHFFATCFLHKSQLILHTFERRGPPAFSM